MEKVTSRKEIKLAIFKTIYNGSKNTKDLSGIVKDTIEAYNQVFGPTADRESPEIENLRSPLSVQIESYNNLKKSSQKAIKLLNDTISDKSRSIDRLKADLFNTNEQLKRKEIEVRNLENKNAHLFSSKYDTEEHNKILSRRINALGEEKIKCEMEINSLVAKVKKMETIINGQNSWITELHKKNNDPQTVEDPCDTKTPEAVTEDSRTR